MGNFKAQYVSDGNTKAVHMLSVDDYADSMEGQQEHSWVLLGKKPPVAPAAAPPCTELVPFTTPAPASVTAGRAGKGKGKAAASAAAGGSCSSAAAPSAIARTQGKAITPVDIRSMSSTQLAELQVLIAQRLQGE